MGQRLRRRRRGSPRAVWGLSSVQGEVTRHAATHCLEEATCRHFFVEGVGGRFSVGVDDQLQERAGAFAGKGSCWGT